MTEKNVIYFKFFVQNLCCSAHWKRLAETLPMSIYSKCFDGEIRNLGIWILLSRAGILPSFFPISWQSICALLMYYCMSVAPILKLFSQKIYFASNIVRSYRPVHLLFLCQFVCQFRAIMGFEARKPGSRYANHKGADQPAHLPNWSAPLLLAYWKVSILNLLQGKFQYSS